MAAAFPDYPGHVERDKGEARLKEKRKSDTKPTLDLEQYTGTFEDDAHGPMVISKNGDTLQAKWGKYTLALKHWHHDVFRLDEYPGLYPEAWGDRLLKFNLNADGEIDSFSYLDHRFRKQKEAKK